LAAIRRWRTRIAAGPHVLSTSCCAISFDAVKQLVIAKVEHRPANLDLGH
jgi:hypothetical protein